MTTACVDLTPPAARRLGAAAGVTGTAAALAGAASAAHEIAPAYLGAFAAVPGRWIAVCAAALVVLTIGLIVAARRRTRRGHGRKVGVVGIVMSLIAVLLLVLGVVTGVLFPAGMVRPAARDAAPVGDTAAMQAQIGQVVGGCPSGWTTLGAGTLPGVDESWACMDRYVAYVTFGSESAERLYRGAARSKALDLLAGHADDPRAQGGWRLLAGRRWIAFGPRPAMEALQREWGGDITALDGADAADGADGAADAGDGGR